MPTAIPSSPELLALDEAKPVRTIDFSKEELEAVQIESNHTIEIDSFVPKDEIDKRVRDVDMERQQVLSTDQLRLEVRRQLRLRQPRGSR